MKNLRTICAIILMVCSLTTVFGQSEKKGTDEKGLSNKNELPENSFLKKGNEFILNPALYKQINTDKELKGMRFYLKKGNKIYKYLGNQNDIVFDVNQNTNRVRECVNCTTVTCNGTTYTCSCVNGFCYCMLCVEITKLSDLMPNNR